MEEGQAGWQWIELKTCVAPNCGRLVFLHDRHPHCCRFCAQGREGHTNMCTDKQTSAAALRRNGGFLKWLLSKSTAIEVLRSCWPFVLLVVLNQFHQIRATKVIQQQFSQIRAAHGSGPGDGRDHQ